MVIGHGLFYSTSMKQRVNVRSSAEAELIVVTDMMVMILWTCHFLDEQGFIVKDNILFQDNHSTMLLANNGKSSSGKRTRHINIRYYFVTDHMKRSKISIDYFPTENMIGEFFTNKLQGALFQKFCRLILNLPNEISNNTDDHCPAEQDCVETSITGNQESVIETSPMGTWESLIYTINGTRCSIQISKHKAKTAQQTYSDVLKIPNT